MSGWTGARALGLSARAAGTAPCTRMAIQTNTLLGRAAFSFCGQEPMAWWAYSRVSIGRRVSRALLVLKQCEPPRVQSTADNRHFSGYSGALSLFWYAPWCRIRRVLLMTLGSSRSRTLILLLTLGVLHQPACAA